MDNFTIAHAGITLLLKGPHTSPISLPISGKRPTLLTVEQLNNVPRDTVNEYANSIRRQVLNDTYMACERYLTLMYCSHKNGQKRTDPATISKKVQPLDFENLDKVFTEEEKKFLQQLRRLRNSLLHYNAVFTRHNKLDYRFGDELYVSEGNFGKSISVRWETLLWIVDKCRSIIAKGNDRYFQTYFNQ